MSKSPKKHSNRPRPLRKNSEVRRATNPDNRRQAERWPSDARIEILSPIQQEAVALDVSATGVQLSLDGWLSTGTFCDLRITTHTGREIYKRARVIWARRVGEECVAGLHVVGSITPPRPKEL
ncbi:MAG: PilZ domain-containing protein [Myxococcales bacterium]|nr:PilZ domain-containing protein [Myxococcales bacterium]MDH3486103.1 PilZ domain-containing protein [Myxococcales bacterium]